MPARGMPCNGKGALPRGKCPFCFFFITRRPESSRDLLEAIPRSERKGYLGELRSIYRAQSKRATVAANWRFALRWRRRHPKLVGDLERDPESLLAIFDLPEAIWPNLTPRT